MHPISIPCSHCGRIVETSAAIAGQTIACPECGASIQVPESRSALEPTSVEETFSNEPPPPMMLAPEDWPTATTVEHPQAEPPLPDWVASQVAHAPASSSARQPRNVSPSPTPSSRWPGLLLSILVPYSLSMTFIAGWLYFRNQQQAAAEHPLANIPDILGEYEPARRMQLGRRLERLPPVDAPLPPGLIVRLGETLTVGDLEVTPEAVEQRRIDIRTVFQSGEVSSTRATRESLVMRLRLKNLSRDIWFHPTDPAFDRRYQPRRGIPRPYTQLIADGYHAYGGAIDWRGHSGRSTFRRVFVVGQDEDDQPLAPGAERRTVVCTDPMDEQVLRSVKAHSGPEPIVWRVLLRRGLIPFEGREWSVCAVVGVTFDASEVRVGRN